MKLLTMNIIDSNLMDNSLSTDAHYKALHYDYDNTHYCLLIISEMKIAKKRDKWTVTLLKQRWNDSY